MTWACQSLPTLPHPLLGYISIFCFFWHSHRRLSAHLPPSGEFFKGKGCVVNTCSICLPTTLLHLPNTAPQMAFGSGSIPALTPCGLGDTPSTAQLTGVAKEWRVTRRPHQTQRATGSAMGMGPQTSQWEPSSALLLELLGKQCSPFCRGRV